MRLVIRVTPRPVYGAWVLDPANDAARHLAAIAGTKTLTVNVLAHAALMGGDVVIGDGAGSVVMARELSKALTVAARGIESPA